MNKEQILSKLKELEGAENIWITTENNDVFATRTKDGWRMKSSWGNLYYTSEELAEELSEWDEMIYRIY